MHWWSSQDSVPPIRLKTTDLRGLNCSLRLDIDRVRNFSVQAIGLNALAQQKVLEYTSRLMCYWLRLLGCRGVNQTYLWRDTRIGPWNCPDFSNLSFIFWPIDVDVSQQGMMSRHTLMTKNALLANRMRYRGYTLTLVFGKGAVVQNKYMPMFWRNHIYIFPIKKASVNALMKLAGFNTNTANECNYEIVVKWILQNYDKCNFVEMVGHRVRKKLNFSHRNSNTRFYNRIKL